MLSDANAEWSAKLGLKSGERTRRYAIILEDLVVKSIEVSAICCIIDVICKSHGSEAELDSLGGNTSGCECLGRRARSCEAVNQ